MKSFVLTLCIASFTGGAATVLAGNVYGKYVKFIASLGCTVLLLSPVVALCKGGADADIADVISAIEQDRDVAVSEVEAEAIMRAEELIRESICTNFDINVCSVSILFDGKTARVEAVTDADPDTAKSISEHILNCFGMGATVYGAE